MHPEGMVTRYGVPRFLGKTVVAGSLPNDVYKKPSSAKVKDESFSTLLERLVDAAESLEVLKRLRGTVDCRDKKAMLKELGL